MHSHRLALLATALLVAAPATAQAQSSFAPMVSVNVPTGTFADAFKTGWGLGAQFTKGNGLMTFVAEAGYNAFSRDTIGTGGYATDDLGVWNFGAGLRASIGPLYAGGVASYFTEIDEFDIIPVVGFHILMLDIGVRYKGLLENSDWVGVSVGFHFGKW
jgi:hypothetical protein